VSSGGALFRLNFSSRSVILAADRTAFEFLIWDPIRAEFIAMPLSSVLSGARVQRSATFSPIVVAPVDQVINCNIPAPATCALPSSASRNGVPLTFNDLGQATANHITLTPNGTEKIDGNANYVLNNNWTWVTLMPFNDGVNSGWKIQ
jgi:hypothetical protein